LLNSYGSLAAAFTWPGVARAYRHRPPYPDEVFGILDGLITDRPRTVLDLGAGEGALARPLAGRTDHVDALDTSAAVDGVLDTRIVARLTWGRILTGSGPA
jgi:hypothetical protein